MENQISATGEEEGEREREGEKGKKKSVRGSETQSGVFAPLNALWLCYMAEILTGIIASVHCDSYKWQQQLQQR